MMKKILLLGVGMLLAVSLMGQNVFSKYTLVNKKALLPYDLPYCFSLPDKQMIMLTEAKKNKMELLRFDEYFFEQWKKEITFDAAGNAPRAVLAGDTLLTWSVTSEKKHAPMEVDFRFFDVKTGSEYDPVHYTFDYQGESQPMIALSANHKKLVVGNYQAADSPADIAFSIFNIGEQQPLKKYSLKKERILAASQNKLFLADNGDLMFVQFDLDSYKLKSCFWSILTGTPSWMEESFYFERPPDHIGRVKIIRQGASSYFITFSALIEEELIGFGIVGLNVVFHNVMFAYNQNFRSDDISQVYEGYYVTGAKQKKKKLAVPTSLKHFDLAGAVINKDQDVILLFEQISPKPKFNYNGASGDMPWKIKHDDDKFYEGGDLLLYCFAANGQKKWQKSIQKTQYSQGSTHALSYLSHLAGNRLDLLIFESSKGGNFYILQIDTIDGSLMKKINLLPDKKYEYVRKYSLFLDGKAVVICTTAPTNPAKRTLQLIEF